MKEQEINLDPQNQKPKKINRLLVMIVSIIIVCAIGYLALPSGDEPKKNDNSENESMSNDLSSGMMSEQEIVKMRQEEERKKAAANKNGTNAQTNNANGSDSNSNSSSNAMSTNQNNEPTNSYSSGNAGNATTRSPEPVVVVSPYEKYQQGKEERSWQMNEKNEIARAAEDVQGQRSKIFFDLNVEKEKSEPSKTNNRTNTVNDYYNNNSDDGYISVVGGR